MGRWRGAWCRHVRASRWAQASDWPNSNLHHAYRQATTITFAGITACQVGTAFATRTNRAVLRTIGVFSNRLLLWGLGFDIAFAAAVIYLPPLQSVFGTASLSILDVVPLAAFRYWYGAATNFADGQSAGVLGEQDPRTTSVCARQPW